MTTQRSSASIAAIVVSYRTGPALQACLEALTQCSTDEIIIADNGNADDEAVFIDAFIAEHAGAALLVRGQGNVGFAAACNSAARAANADVLAFVNPDAVLLPNALGQMAAVLEGISGPAIVGGDLRDAAGRPDRGARRERLTLWRGFVSFTGLSRLGRVLPAFRDFHQHNDSMPTTPLDTPTVSGALMVMRRKDFLALGGFDEGYFLHVEDIDLCRRAADAGWRVVFAPGPHGVHYRSTSAVPGAVIARHKARSFRRYFRKFARGAFEGVVAELVGAFLILTSRLRR